jgi:alkylation response protein AidB-like acyl-CoA dehydrogenase
VLDGGQWIINGQKVWTSLALGAVDLRGGPHREGLQAARRTVLPAGAAGPTGRRDPPIVQLTGDSEFNEVFTDARTDALVVGAGDGWRVAMGTLTFERGVSTLGQQIRYARELSGIVALAKDNGSIDDPLIRERLTRAWVGLRPCGPTRWPPWTSNSRGGQHLEAVVGQLAPGSGRAGHGCAGQGGC